MKTVKTLLLVAAIIVSVLSGCSSNTQPNPSTAPSITTEPTTTTEPDEIDVYQFKEVETIHENIDIYRAEVSARLKRVENGENFLSEEETEIIKRWEEDVEHEEVEFNTFSFTTFNRTFTEMSNFFYPVLYREGHSLILWYTTESGSVLLERVDGWLNGGNYIGHLHCDTQEEDWVRSHNGSVLTWNEESYKINLWHFGEVVESFNVPEESVYCGFSDFEGHLFRHGTDVYALDLDTQTWSGTLTCIAHGVQFVIDSSYAQGSDPWSQPLFLMEDGSIKAYVSWEGDKDAPVDDPSHLVDPWYEGSYQ